MTRTAFFILLLLVVCGPQARADEVPGEPSSEAAAAEATRLDVGVITGDRVNVRVGPRIDNHAVTQLAAGEVVLVLEKRDEWYAVRLPGGFTAAISTDHTTAEGPDVLRVTSSRVNLRVHPPIPGKPAPGIFHDRLERGTLLPLIETVEVREEGSAETEEGHSIPVRSSGWALVVAPEQVRVYVHEDYVKLLASTDSEHAELVAAARLQREARRKNLAAARQAEARRAAGLRLMQTLGAVQQDLQTLRRIGGTDKTPIVVLSNRMDEGIEEDGAAVESVLRLARALREDLEREIQLRVARYQAEVARTRGLDAPAVQRLEPVVEKAVLEGEIRYEPTPGWTASGVYFLWMDGRPRFALRLTTGGPLPHPDFKAHAGGGVRKLRGRRPGDRLFGLPVFEVRRIELPEGS